MHIPELGKPDFDVGKVGASILGSPSFARRSRQCFRQCACRDELSSAQGIAAVTREFPYEILQRLDWTSENLSPASGSVGARSL